MVCFLIMNIKIGEHRWNAEKWINNNNILIIIY